MKKLIAITAIAIFGSSLVSLAQEHQVTQAQNATAYNNIKNVNATATELTGLFTATLALNEAQNTSLLRVVSTHIIMTNALSSTAASGSDAYKIRIAKNKEATFAGIKSILTASQYQRLVGNSNVSNTIDTDFANEMLNSNHQISADALSVLKGLLAI